MGKCYTSHPKCKSANMRMSKVSRDVVVIIIANSLYFCFYTDFPPVRINISFVGLIFTTALTPTHSMRSLSSHVALRLSTRFSFLFAVVSVLMNDAVFFCFVLIIKLCKYFEKFCRTAASMCVCRACAVYVY